MAPASAGAEGWSAAGCVNVVSFPAVDVLLKAVGDTPIMKTKKWAVERTRTIQSLVDFIKKFLKLMASEQLVREDFWQAGPLCAADHGRDWKPTMSGSSAYPRPMLSHLAGRPCEAGVPRL